MSSVNLSKKNPTPAKTASEKKICFEGTKSIYSIIKASLFTEKSTKDLANRKYAFLVASDANKIEIKRALEKIYKVKVDKVASAIIKGKTKRIRFNQPGKTTSWKKAVVTLKEGFEIKLS